MCFEHFPRSLQLPGAWRRPGAAQPCTVGWPMTYIGHLTFNALLHVCCITKLLPLLISIHPHQLCNWVLFLFCYSFFFDFFVDVIMEAFCNLSESALCWCNGERIIRPLDEVLLDGGRPRGVSRGSMASCPSSSTPCPVSNEGPGFGT